ncbi:hypothetical protein J1605_013005 [Eschrichtius robustus]|uniref:Uncharacterized protein n=1 Tax=Eschrichtius robustus TaxID=9764 RepID=A0AB34GI86_ESCRO|nr:hypothetical protein J1605_013005 [Eschrichtius robustus]
MSTTTWLDTAEVVQVVEKVQEVYDTWLHCWGPQEQRAICAVSHGAQVSMLRQELRKRDLGQVSVCSLEILPDPQPCVLQGLAPWEGNQMTRPLRGCRAVMAVPQAAVVCSTQISAAPSHPQACSQVRAFGTTCPGVHFFAGLRNFTCPSGCIFVLPSVETSAPDPSPSRGSSDLGNRSQCNSTSPWPLCSGDSPEVSELLAELRVT